MRPSGNSRLCRVGRRQLVLTVMMLASAGRARRPCRARIDFRRSKSFMPRERRYRGPFHSGARSGTGLRGGWLETSTINPLGAQLWLREKPAAAGLVPSLNGLRAFSISIVFLSHNVSSALFPGGFGVRVFFVLE